MQIKANIIYRDNIENGYIVTAQIGEKRTFGSTMPLGRAIINVTQGASARIVVTLYDLKKKIVGEFTTPTMRDIERTIEKEWRAKLA